MEQLSGKVRHRIWRTKQQARTGIGRTVGLRLRSHGLQARGHSHSDYHVFHEIFGGEDSYKLGALLPLMRGGTVVEIGAHKGYFTVLAGSVAERVLVFEPEETNFRYLLKNVALNGQHNVTAVQEAIASENGTRTFSVSGITDARHTFFPSHYSGAGRQVEVRCTTLPDALRTHGVDVVDVLKLDCEGGEYDVVLGSSPASWDDVVRVVLEHHPHPERTWSDLRAFFAERGLQVVREVPVAPDQGTAWLARAGT